MLIEKLNTNTVYQIYTIPKKKTKSFISVYAFM